MLVLPKRSKINLKKCINRVKWEGRPEWGTNRIVMDIKMIDTGERRERGGREEGERRKRKEREKEIEWQTTHLILHHSFVRKVCFVSS